MSSQRSVDVEFSLETGKEVLRNTPAVIRALVSNLSDQWVESDEGAGTWTPYQVVVHLAHIEECDWIDRTKVILEHGPDHVFVPVDREAGFERFSGWTVVELIDRFDSLRSSNLNTLDEVVKADDLIRSAKHPDFGSVTLSQLLATWVVHDLNHIGQIVKTMAKQYDVAVGPWREYLPIIDAK